MTDARNGKKITIYDIAILTGTSPSTVGSVLNGTWKRRRISAKRAQEIKQIADEQGYTLNMQASALRREKSSIIGMIVPMYDNRYFSSIAQMFEQKARSRGLFPMISCTLRDPELEMESVRLMLNYQVEQIICTGATAPDQIQKICEKRNVPTINLDLPGLRAPSVITNNYKGAFELTEKLLKVVSKKENENIDDVIFIGGRSFDHNTKERARGFLDANSKMGIDVDEQSLITCGYAADKALDAFDAHVRKTGKVPSGIFVNSTISLEGVLTWFKNNGLEKLKPVSLGCFDWDPFAAYMESDIIMVRQNVPEMMNELFKMIDGEKPNAGHIIEIPPTIVDN